MPISLTPRPATPPGWVEIQDSRENIGFTYISKAEAFMIGVFGLMPSTRHYVFFEGVRVSDDKIKPLNQNIGAPLYTDENGQAQFVFYYQSDIQADVPMERFGEVSQRIGGDKELVCANAPDTTLSIPTSDILPFSSYCKQNIMFKATAISELPIKTNYSFAYPVAPVVPSLRQSSEDGGFYYTNGGDGGSDG
jgi:hypothetical protein